MKFKAFLLTLLMFLTPIWGMEPQAQKAAITLETIKYDDVCLQCHRIAQDIPQHELCITNCCKKFLCDTDAQKIIEATEDANLKAESEAFAAEEKIRRATSKVSSNLNSILKEADEIIKKYGPHLTQNKLVILTKPLCPYCSKELSTTKVFLKKSFIQKPVVKIIDSDNKEFDLNQELSNALLQCGSFAMREDVLNTASTAAPLDFSAVIPTQGRFLKQDLIVKLAELINDPIVHASNIPQNIAFFELAHYLEAPVNILYIVANELWPLMQETQNDAPHIKKYKEYLKEVARPHLACPHNLLRYLRSIPASMAKQFKDNANQSEINFSFDAIKKNLQNNGWYQDNEQNWYKIYPFYSLNGLAELLTYLEIDTDNWRLRSFNLSNHFIETFTCDFAGSIETLNLSNNKIKKLTGNQLLKREGGRLPRGLILTNNPINTVDESFFEALRKARTTGYNSCEISLENNLFSDTQKQEVRKKFYTATHTIPERYLNRDIFEKAFLYGGALAGIGAGLYAGNKLGNYAPNLVKNISVTSCVALGIIAGACREMYSHRRDESVPWFFFDVLAGAAGSYFGSKKLFNYKPQATKVIPMVITGMAGALTGGLVAKGTGNILANGLARISHPKIPSVNTWSNGTYTIRL